MIGLAIRFDLGRYHANPWGTHVNEARTEWPPSSWRMIRALYSTSRTNVSLAEQRSAIDRALQKLIDAPPPIYVLPPATAAHTRHYMPLSSYSPLRNGDTSKVLDGFLAVDPQAELRVMWDVELDADTADALAAVIRCLSYIGRSESVCSAEMIAGTRPRSVSAEPVDTAELDEGQFELTNLLCPLPGQQLDDVVISVSDLRKRRQLVPPGTEQVTYAVATRDQSNRDIQRHDTQGLPTLALLRLRGPSRPGLTEAVAVGQALRSALQHVYGRQNEGAASPTFSGRRGDQPRSDQHLHAHYLALPDGNGPRVDRLVVWAPEGFQAHEVAALAAVSHLSMHDVPERLPTALAALATEADLDLAPLTGTGREWQSITPFGLVRHPKTRGGGLRDSPVDQVRDELVHRGQPEPVEVTLEPGSWHRFRGHKAGQSRLQRARLFGVRLRFDEPVRGPLALGAFSHFGLGLFRRVD